MHLALDDQVAFVAGSSRGIGRAIAARLLGEGARVVITGRDEVTLQATRDALCVDRGDDRVLAIAGDLADGAVAANALARTRSTFGCLDHVIANIGSGRGTAGVHVPDAEWQRMFDVNFFAPVRLAQAALPHLGAGGSVLFVASIVALEATDASLAYSAAKAALVNYANNLARRLGLDGIRVNAIAPGNIFFEGGSWAEHRARDPDGVASMLAREVPLGRFGTVDEIASLAAWLCSPLAGFATGGCHVVDGGQTRTP